MRYVNGVRDRMRIVVMERKLFGVLDTAWTWTLFSDRNVMVARSENTWTSVSSAQRNAQAFCQLIGRLDIPINTVKERGE